MIGPFRTLVQSRYRADARTFIRSLANQERVSLEIAREDLCAARFDTDDYRATTEVLSDGTFCWLRTRLYDNVFPDDAYVPTSFIASLHRAVDLHDAEVRLSPACVIIDSNTAMAGLLSHILNPERRLPIIAMSEPFNPELVAAVSSLLGIVHVVRVASRLSHRFVETLGPEWPAHGGAIRTFGVPFPGPRSQHPIMLAHNQPDGEWYVRRVRRFAVYVARHFPFPAMDAPGAVASNAPLSA